MYDAFTITLIILSAALLRWSLLSDPGTNCVRVDGEDNGFMTLVPAQRADRPHPAHKARAKR